MGKTVYDQLLKRYTDLRSAYLKKVADAKNGIELAQKALESNSAKMAEAIAKEDQDTYVRLSAENDKHEKAIEYYTELLNKIQSDEQSDSAYDPDEVNDMLQTAKAEISRISAEYEKKMRDLANQMQLVSAEARVQYSLLRLARNKIASNLAHKVYQDQGQTAHEAMPALGAFDPFYKNLTKNFLMREEQNASEKLSGESSKWI